VHTTGLASDEFELTIDGRAATIETLFPGFSEHDRLGIVIGADHGAAGAGTLILAAVTAFYDRLRARQDDFFAYADYFAFHVGVQRGSLRKLDVYPEHKEVVVADEAEQILRAINDRAITRLLVADGPVQTAELGRDTRASAQRRIRTAIAYSPGGRVAGADVVIRGSAVTESFIAAMLATGRDEPPDASPHAGLVEAGRRVESYRRIALGDALGLLGSSVGATAVGHA
jgi:hypothetical protein